MNHNNPYAEIFLFDTDLAEGSFAPLAETLGRL